MQQFERLWTQVVACGHNVRSGRARTTVDSRGDCGIGAPREVRWEDIQ
jgi:hypothetical protein